MADVWGANDWVKVTPADDTDVGFSHSAIIVFTAGDLTIKKTSAASAITIPVAAGQLIPFKVYSIQATNTDADDIFLVR